jgi:hypothetical protein
VLIGCIVTAGRYFAVEKEKEFEKKIRGNAGGPSPDILFKIKCQSHNQIFASLVRYVKIIL